MIGFRKTQGHVKQDQAQKKKWQLEIDQAQEAEEALLNSIKIDKTNADSDTEEIKKASEEQTKQNAELKAKSKDSLYFLCQNSSMSRNNTILDNESNQQNKNEEGEDDHHDNKNKLYEWQDSSDDMGMQVESF